MRFFFLDLNIVDDNGKINIFFNFNDKFVEQLVKSNQEINAPLLNLFFFQMSLQLRNIECIDRYNLTLYCLNLSLFTQSHQQQIHECAKNNGLHLPLYESHELLNEDTLLIDLSVFNCGILYIDNNFNILLSDIDPIFEKFRKIHNDFFEEIENKLSEMDISDGHILLNSLANSFKELSFFEDDSGKQELLIGDSPHKIEVDNEVLQDLYTLFKNDVLEHIISKPELEDLVLLGYTEFNDDIKYDIEDDVDYYIEINRAEQVTLGFYNCLDFYENSHIQADILIDAQEYSVASKLLSVFARFDDDLAKQKLRLIEDKNTIS